MYSQERAKRKKNLKYSNKSLENTMDPKYSGNEKEMVERPVHLTNKSSTARPRNPHQSAHRSTCTEVISQRIVFLLAVV